MRRSHARTRIDSKPDKMDPIKLHIRPTSRSTNLFSRTPKNTKSNLLFTLTVALTAAFFTIIPCYYLFFYTHKTANPNSVKYGVVIDGGSTGTRIHVFSYRRESNEFDFELGNMRVNPGLSSYAENPEFAGESLKQLIDFGKGKVPAGLWDETEIRLMATAGLRLLDLKVQEKILRACREVLRASGFMFRDEWATVITGSDEGVYAWVVANYALGSLGGDPLKTTGIIELGGASAQVTFVSNEPMPPEFSRTIKFGNATYNLYSHSFLHFGQNVAFESLKELITSGGFNSAVGSLRKRVHIDPCSPKGYSHDMESWKLSADSSDENNEYLSTLQAGGNFSECRSAALMLLQKGKDKCSYKSCYLGSTFMPKLQGTFLATENFFHTSKFFRLRERAFLSDLLIAGEQFCGEDWSKLKNKYPSLDEDLMRYCFSSAYIVALLHDSLGIALDDERIGYGNHVGNIPLDWALGAFILQSTSDLDVHNSGWIATIISDDSPTLLSLIAISILLMFIAWSVSKWRKPQLKTIYDLEKGRYIVSRVSR
ncbi:hypothetical protein Patl1_15939 [Pistacia atlantica]|uniref:Uncharacterized protein n=1 Tax=Pistacia atlantica TaxID=434234 RepID=A0ACC1B9A4_9ROSI|nr:hypothetical protein Patl1_15939 [Pistacia atlantica]